MAQVKLTRLPNDGNQQVWQAEFDRRHPDVPKRAQKTGAQVMQEVRETEDIDMPKGVEFVKTTFHRGK